MHRFGTRVSFIEPGFFKSELLKRGGDNGAAGAKVVKAKVVKAKKAEDIAEVRRDIHPLIVCTNTMHPLIVCTMHPLMPALLR